MMFSFISKIKSNLYLFLLILIFIGAAKLVVSLKTSDKILEFGYPLEIYETQSKDGYMLGLERIPHSRNVNKTSKIGKPVLMVHGLYGTSMLFAAVNTSQAYALSDAGYDVWLMNFRLSGISKLIKDPKSGIIPPLQNVSWDFSMEELAIYDLTASIDYVLNITGYEKLDLTGFSLGNTIILIALSELPEYQNKVNKIVMIVPTTRMKTYHAPAWRMYFLIKLRIKGEKYIPKLPDYDNQIFGYNCMKNNLFWKYYCRNVVNSVQGISLPYNRKALELLKVYPQPTAVKVLFHVYQHIRSDHFCKYDYGPIQNIKYYNSTVPPDYDLTKIIVPSYILHSKIDSTATPEDIKWLVNQLPNVKKTRFIKEARHSHLGIIINSEANKITNNFMVQSLNDNS
ncbi:gastric triacylglycerol lipase-like [Daktulosphaira vitifoliae]|uniref:gastric triacylglycerol lipase-like n=1 Tax=Daktulosphaira vitifoliae TaxID=58002 RepID=UPI0021AA958A|nr:gastric triacylglycerol lipase-like [Daktulosphaira vitifoliae]